MHCVKKEIFYFSIVDESGASIYSVTEEAKKEFKNLDPNLISSGKGNYLYNKKYEESNEKIKKQKF